MLAKRARNERLLNLSKKYVFMYVWPLHSVRSRRRSFHAAPNKNQNRHSSPAGYLIYLNRILFKLKNSIRFGKRITWGQHKRPERHKHIEMYANIQRFDKFHAISIWMGARRRQHLLHVSVVWCFGISRTFITQKNIYKYNLSKFFIKYISFTMYKCIKICLFHKNACWINY